MLHISNRLVVCVPSLFFLALQPTALTAPPASASSEQSATLVAEKQQTTEAAPADGAAMEATPPLVQPVAGSEVLKTPAIVTEPEPEPTPPAQNGENPNLKALAAQGQASQAFTGSTPPMAAADVLMAPFGEITDFSLGHTLPGSKWRLYPHASLSGIFDDNIFLDSSHKVSDFYFALSPGLGAAYGTEESPLKVRADYTASFLAFMKNSSQDTVDQNALLRVSYELPKVTLGLNLGFQSLDGASLDVGDRVRRQIYYAGLTSNYVLDDKFSVDLDADETVADYDGLDDSNETRVQAWLNYQATGKIKVGVGLEGGYLDVQNGPGQTYEELLGRVNYDATGKLVLYATGGVDFRQSDKTTVAPVFSVGGAYTPFAKTTITVDIHERIYPSAALDGQNYRATGIMAGVNQELFENLSAFLDVGYENASYYAVENGIAANRVDNYVYARIGPDWQIRQWWHLSSFYEFSRNDSTGIGSRPFTRNRVGIQANFAF